MAVETLYNHYITVNGVDLSTKCKSLKVVKNQEVRMISAGGDVVKKHIAGIGEDRIEAVFFQDRAAGSVLATLRPLVGVNVAAVNVVAKYKNAAAAATNEQYTLSSIISGEVPLINGAWGEVEEVPITFVSASGSGIAVATS